MQTEIIETKESIQKFKSFSELSSLPAGLAVATTTLTCKVNTTINLENLGKYLSLSEGRVIYKKYGDRIDSLILKKSRAKKKTKTVLSFYNQVTVVIQSKDNSTINFKLFKNGAIHATGCKSTQHFTSGVNILFDELKVIKAVYDPISRQIIRKPFVDSPENLTIDNMNEFSIRMINTGYNIGFEIDREALFNILKSMDVTCTYEPCVHACVNIKYNYDDIDVLSIFVFESGSIIITGVKTRDQIDAAYKFITKFIYNNYNQVLKQNTSAFLERPDIKKLINDSNIVYKLRDISGNIQHVDSTVLEKLISVTI